MKKLIKSSQSVTSSDDVDTSLVHNTGAIISAMEQLSEAFIGDDVASDYGYLTGQELEEFKKKCTAASQKLLDTALELNEELLQYLNVRYSEHPDYSGYLAVGPMGDI